MTLPYFETDVATVHWVTVGQSGIVDVHVFDPNGDPVGGQQVHVDDPSRGGWGKTDAAGHARVRVEGPEWTGLMIGNRKIFDNAQPEWSWTYGPRIGRGTQVVVQFKKISTVESATTGFAP